jgi:hypothetical protein
MWSQQKVPRKNLTFAYLCWFFIWVVLVEVLGWPFLCTAAVVSFLLSFGGVTFGSWTRKEKNWISLGAFFTLRPTFQ